jgi:hypothetical protein
MDDLLYEGGGNTACDLVGRVGKLKTSGSGTLADSKNQPATHIHNDTLS